MAGGPNNPEDYWSTGLPSPVNIDLYTSYGRIFLSATTAIPSAKTGANLIGVYESFHGKYGYSPQASASITSCRNPGYWFGLSTDLYNRATGKQAAAGMIPATLTGAAVGAIVGGGLPGALIGSGAAALGYAVALGLSLAYSGVAWAIGEGEESGYLC